VAREPKTVGGERLGLFNAQGKMLKSLQGKIVSVIGASKGSGGGEALARASKVAARCGLYFRASSTLSISHPACC
jgi:hypothetical protein